MKTINLKKYYYPICKKDTFVEVPDEVADAIVEESRAEDANDAKQHYHCYSLDASPGMENHFPEQAVSPEDILMEKETEREQEAARALMMERLREALASLLNIAFIVGINTCGSFVQNNDRRILQNTARNRNTLFLTAGKSSAAFSNHGLEPVRQSHDEIIAAGFFCRFIDVFLRGIRFSHADVVIDRILEQIHPLEHHTDLIHQLRQGYIPNIHTSNCHTAGFYIPQPGQQICDSGFTATGRTDQSRHRVFLHSEIDMV